MTINTQITRCARHINYKKRIQEAEEIYNYLNIPSNKKLTILEIGMGIGHLSHYLMTKGHTVIATDVNYSFGWVKNKDLKIIYQIAYKLLDPKPEKKIFEYKMLTHDSKMEFKRLESYLPDNKKYDLILFTANSMHIDKDIVPKEQDYKFLVQELFKLSNKDARFIMGFYPAFDEYEGYGYKFLYENRIKERFNEKLFGEIAVEFNRATYKGKWNYN